jgi:DNA repair exonuclease SbcCD ATPase subunit
LEKKVTAYSRQKESLENRVTILSKDYDKEKLTALRLELRKVGEEEAALSSKSVMLSRRLVERRALLKEAEMRVATLGKYKKDVEASSNAVAGMNGFVKVLKLTQEQLRAEFLKSVNSILGDIWKLLYPYGDFTGIRLSAEDDYSLQLQETGVRAADAASSGWIGVEAVSGGERSIAALALRIAFSRAFLPNLKWLILDEPTHNLDANAIKQFSEILREKMGMFAEQVFLITHEERISEGVTGNLYRLERDKENEGVTKAVAV